MANAALANAALRASGFSLLQFFLQQREATPQVTVVETRNQHSFRRPC
jgi:hypothetical protein